MNPSRPRAYTVQWNELARWDLKSARAAAFRAAHPFFRPIGDFIEEATDIIHPAREPDHAWPVYGVSNRDGVFLSHTQLGSDFNSAYKRIRKDWFFHNPTRANVGSLGRVPEVPSDALTSPEYQVWRIRDGLFPEFVEILIRLPFFIDLVECHRVGAVKERLFVENLREIPIPHLSEAQQARIIDMWRSARREITELQERIKEQRAAIDAQFYSDLGLTKLDRIAVPKAFALRWKDLRRWGVETSKLGYIGADLTHGTFPLVRGREVFVEVKHGSSASPSSTRTTLDVLKISAVTKGRFDPTERKFAVENERSRLDFSLRKGDVLLCRTNGTLAYVGMSAVVEEDYPDLIFPDKLMRVRTKAELDPTYLWFILQTVHVRAQIEAAARTAVGNYAIGTEDVMHLEIPFPPIKIQKTIIDRVRIGREKIAKLNDTAQNLNFRIVADVEAAVLRA